MPKRCRLRDLGITPGRLPPGPLNAITDVKGVRVGHVTLNYGHVRSGVTAIWPNSTLGFTRRVAAGGFVLNGAGELTGLHQVLEWGMLEVPILLTGSLGVGTCAQGSVSYLIRRYPEIGRTEDVVLPVVGECDDSFLNDAACLPVTTEHVWAALDAARAGPVAEGSVGAGTGMMTCDFKAGIGTASRQVPQGYLVGALVLSNFGVWEDLRVAGRPAADLVASALEGVTLRRSVPGSIIVVLATDAPMLTHQLSRLAKRASMGIARIGSCAHHGSGDIMLAFSTTEVTARRPQGPLRRLRCVWDSDLDPLFLAAVEATEEAILNALCMAEPMEGVAGHRAVALPLEALR